MSLPKQDYISEAEREHSRELFAAVHVKESSDIKSKLPFIISSFDEYPKSREVAEGEIADPGVFPPIKSAQNFQFKHIIEKGAWVLELTDDGQLVPVRDADDEPVTEEAARQDYARYMRDRTWEGGKNYAENLKIHNLKKAEFDNAASGFTKLKNKCFSLTLLKVINKHKGPHEQWTKILQMSELGMTEAMAARKVKLDESVWKKGTSFATFLIEQEGLIEDYKSMGGRYAKFEIKKNLWDKIENCDVGGYFEAALDSITAVNSKISLEDFTDTITRVESTRCTRGKVDNIWDLRPCKISVSSKVGGGDVDQDKARQAVENPSEGAWGDFNNCSGCGSKGHRIRDCPTAKACKCGWKFKMGDTSCSRCAGRLKSQNQGGGRRNESNAGRHGDGGKGKGKSGGYVASVSDEVLNKEVARRAAIRAEADNEGDYSD